MGERFVRACRWAAGRLRARPAGRSPAIGRMREAIAFAGLGVEPHEVVALARLAALLVAAGAGVACALLLVLQAPWTLLLAPWALPLLVSSLVLRHPESLARGLQRASAGEAPEAISYLAMSLRVRPSLERAVAFASEHAGRAFGSRLRRALWQVHLRCRTGIEDAFTALADEWGAWNGEMKRALYLIAHGVREGSADGLPRALDRAREVVFEGAARRVREYAARLRGPTTALFALGVLLPLIVGSMLPLLSFGGFRPTALEVQDPSPGNPLPWILLFDVAFPAVTFTFARHVSSGRPGMPSPRGPAPASVRRLYPLSLLPLALLPAVVVGHPLAPLLSLGAVVLLVSAALFLATRDEERARRRVAELEREFPDALFQLGSRLSEGRGLEDALLAVARGTRGTPSGALFGQIARSLPVGGSVPVRDALFGAGGPIRDVRSRTVRASLRMVTELAAKDPAAAGRAALETSTYLRDLHAVGRDLAAELRPTVDSMQATAAFFAPVVLGATAAMYGLMSSAFATFSSPPLHPTAFAGVLAVYLVLTTVAIGDFVTRVALDSTRSLGAWLARTLPAAYGVFLVSLALAGAALGA